MACAVGSMQSLSELHSPLHWQVPTPSTAQATASTRCTTPLAQRTKPLGIWLPCMKIGWGSTQKGAGAPVVSDSVVIAVVAVVVAVVVVLVVSPPSVSIIDGSGPHAHASARRKLDTWRRGQRWKGSSIAPG